MSRRIVSGIILFLLLFSMSAFGYKIQLAKSEPATIVVPDDYLTIQEAVDNANDGDIVFVRNGTYLENVVVDKSLTLLGEDNKGTIIESDREGNVVTVKASNTVVKGFTVKSQLEYETRGIFLDRAYNSSVCNNNITQNGYGVIAYYSAGCRISHNNFYRHAETIIMHHSPRSSIFRNNITSTWTEALLIHHSSDMMIFGNNIDNARHGIGVFNSYSVSILDNNISRAYYTAIVSENFTGTVCQNDIIKNHASMRIYEEFQGRIYHNSFVNNWYQNPYVDASFMSVWDDGYPSGGNYWSSYNGSDLYSGTYQNETGSDGIGDTPYFVDENNTDNYPLMEPHFSAHAIALGYVGSDRTTVGQGIPVNIELGIVNYGYFTETFNVTVYANTSVIYHTNVSLTSRDAAILTFPWSTGGVAKGNHTITAGVTPVPGETDVTDNNNTCWVIISMVGDLTGPDGWPDGKVDMRDIGTGASAFGSYPGHERWNQKADITGSEYLIPDNKVDMRDIALVARHFGETDP